MNIDLYSILHCAPIYVVCRPKPIVCKTVSYVDTFLFAVNTKHES